MLPWRAFLVCLLWAAVTWACAAGEAPPSPEKLIEVIEKGDFDQRQEAIRRLGALGEQARPALEKAAEQSEVLEVRATAERLLERLNCARLELEAYDRHGLPFAGAALEVLICPSPAAPDPVPRGPVDGGKTPLCLTTDGHGRAVLEKLHPGPAFVRAVFKDALLAPYGQGPSAINLRPGDNRMQFIVERGGTLSGMVVAAADGKPLADAAIVLCRDGGEDLEELGACAVWLPHLERENNELRATSGATGRFSIQRVPEGSYLVLVRRPDCVPACGGRARVREGSRVELPATIGLTARASAYGVIRARLLDDKGEPLKNAKVRVTVTPTFEGPGLAGELARLKARLEYVLANSLSRPGSRELAVDADGCLELKDLPPGAHRVAAQTEEDEEAKVRKYLFEDVTVAAGKTTEAAGQKPAACGSLTGQILDPLGERSGLEVWALSPGDPEQALVLSDLRRYQSWFGQWDEEPDLKADVDKGRFEFRRLIPGLYTLVMVKDRELAGVLHGVDVAAGKLAQAPVFRLAGPEGPAARGQLSGVVLLPDGKPAEGASVRLVCRGSRGYTLETRCQDGGAFSFRADDLRGPPARLLVYLSGYRVLHVDLAAQPQPWQGGTLRLDRQQRGSLAVTVCAPDGRPLKGAAVAPRGGSGATYVHFDQRRAQTVVTDRLGRAVLHGLACGRRQVLVARDGYYLPQPVELEVAPDAVASVTVMLRRGLTLQGSVQVPAGSDRSRAVVSANCASFSYGTFHEGYALSAGVNAQGRFEFNGLPPGKVWLTAQCPGLVCAQDQTEVEVSERTPEVKLHLVHAGGLEVELGAADRGWGMKLAPPGSWDPGRGARTELQAYEDTADGSGHIEVRGVRPGPYDLLFSPPDAAGPDSRAFRSRASLVWPAAAVPALAGGAAEFGKLQPLRPRWPEGSGAASGRLVLRAPAVWQPDETGVATLRVTIVGERALGTCAFAVPEGLDPRRAPPVLGQPRGDFRLDPPGAFTLSGLPPAEYRVYLEYEFPEKAGAAWETRRVDAGPRPARTFQAEDGRTAQLGEIVLESPPGLAERMRRACEQRSELDWRYDENDEGLEDEGPVFQP